MHISLEKSLLVDFANYFLKDLIKNKFSSRFSYLNEKFKKNEFSFFLIYRFVGGIPFFISNNNQNRKSEKFPDPRYLIFVEV